MPGLVFSHVPYPRNAPGSQWGAGGLTLGKMHTAGSEAQFRKIEEDCFIFFPPFCQFHSVSAELAHLTRHPAFNDGGTIASLQGQIANNCHFTSLPHATVG
jgi:hypothetical protein